MPQSKLEVGHRVDGVIVLPPFLIGHVLQIIGPVYVPGYKETITAQNLEDRLHYYQLNNSGIANQIAQSPGVTSTSDRKRFTGLLAQLVLNKIRQAPSSEILAIARVMLHDLKTRDLQVYFSNPQVEDLLMKYNYASQVDRSTTHDGLFVVEANLSASKASQYVQTIMHDTVTLDANGGATHVLQLRLVYNQIGPVYGYDTYHDYVRIYVPPDSPLLWGDGFASRPPLVRVRYHPPPLTGGQPPGQLPLPAGQFPPLAATASITRPHGGA